MSTTEQPTHPTPPAPISTSQRSTRRNQPTPPARVDHSMVDTREPADPPRASPPSTPHPRASRPLNGRHTRSAAASGHIPRGSTLEQSTRVGDVPRATRRVDRSRVDTPTFQGSTRPEARQPTAAVPPASPPRSTTHQPSARISTTQQSTRETAAPTDRAPRVSTTERSTHPEARRRPRVSASRSRPEARPCPARWPSPRAGPCPHVGHRLACRPSNGRHARTTRSRLPRVSTVEWSTHRVVRRHIPRVSTIRRSTRQNNAKSTPACVDC